MKTTLAKTHIMILLAVFLTAPLLANLPCVTGTCTGEGSCRICGEGKTGASGKDMSRSLNSMRVPGTGNASNGSLQVAISFGNVPNEHLSLPAEFSTPSGNTKIKCFKVTLPVASTLIQEMNKLVEGDTSYQGSYGLISWGEHGSNCRSFSQTFYNEFKRFEYNGDYPECK